MRKGVGIAALSFDERYLRMLAGALTSRPETSEFAAGSAHRNARCFCCLRVDPSQQVGDDRFSRSGKDDVRLRRPTLTEANVAVERVQREDLVLDAELNGEFHSVWVITVESSDDHMVKPRQLEVVIASWCCHQWAGPTTKRVHSLLQSVAPFTEGVASVDQAGQNAFVNETSESIGQQIRGDTRQPIQ